MNSSPPTARTRSDKEGPVVAVFDFDGTVTRRDTLLPFLWHVVGPMEFFYNTVVLLPTLVRYVLGTLDNGPAKEHILAQFLGSKPVNEIRDLAKQFAESTIPHLLNPVAIRRLQRHRELGHVTVLLSASPELYIEPWAKSAGFDAVIGTRLAISNEAFTGRFATPNCYGQEKVRRLLKTSFNLSEATVFAYGNSRGDRELLEYADHPFYQTFGNASQDHNPPPNDQGDGSSLSIDWRHGLLASVIVGMGLYVGLTLWSGVDQIIQGLRAVSLLTLLGLLLLVFAGYLVRFGRWHWYLWHLGLSVPWRINLRVFLASFALTATPGKAGESIRAYFLKHTHSIPPSKSLTALFAERFTDVLSVVLVICMGLFLLGTGRSIVLTVGALQLVLIAALQHPQWIRRSILLPVARWTVVRQWIRPLDAMLATASKLLRPKALLVGIVLGGIPWIAEGIAMYVLFQSLGADVVGLHEAVLIHAAATLFGALTFLPGGLGGHEAASITLALFHGALRSQAVVATVLVRLLTLWFAVVIGISTLSFSADLMSDP